MTEAPAPSLFAAQQSFDEEASFAIFAGDRQAGFNVCVELCDRWAGGERTALRWAGGTGAVETVTFEEARRRASRFAHVLASMGVKPGDRVAGLLPRTPDMLTVYLGALRAGAAYQPLFTAFGPKAIETRIQGSKAKVIVTDAANRSKLHGLADVAVLVTDRPEGAESFSQAMAAQRDEFSPVMLGANDPFLMMFTSGTTGTPKGVMVPVHMLRTIWAYMRYSIDLRDDDIYWNLGDPAWAYGLYYGVTGPLLLGLASTLSEAPFSVERTYDLIRRLGITNLAGAPTAYRAMAASRLQPPTGMRAISSAGEPLDPETGSWLARNFGCPARDHYGQTETGMIICDHNGLDHPRRQGAIGYTMPGFRVATVSPDGQECADGEPGLVAVDRRSPLFWFQGYQGRAEQPFIREYYLTGDSAVRESDGAFRFVAREDDVITSSGYRIGPFEVESVLMEHPAVAEAAVIGRPDPFRTEVVKAFLTLVPGYEGTPALAEEIGLFVKQRLAAHSYPREIDFVSELPKTPSGKVQRFVLRQQEVERRRASEADAGRSNQADQAR